MASLLLEHARAGTRDSRAFDRTRKRTLGDLAGRTVWSAGGAPAQRLRRHLEWSGGDGVRAEPLRGAEDVRPGDIVVLHQPLTAAPAQDIRQLGAHAVWHVLSAREQSPAVDAYLLTCTTAVGAQVVAAGAGCRRGLRQGNARFHVPGRRLVQPARRYRPGGSRGVRRRQPARAPGGRSPMTHLVQLVADYGPGDLAYAELTQRLALPGRLPTYPAGSQGPPEAHAILRPGDAWRRI